VDDREVAVPGATASVIERRIEPFARVGWKLLDALSVDAGVRIESSSLRLDNRDSRQFRFIKPHAQLEWIATPRTTLQLRAERLVGQLDFEDFASSASLSTDTVTAGNADLEPDRTWRTEVSVRRAFARDGALVLTARHDRISQVIDRVPIYADEVFDSVGNIPAGRRDEIEMELTWPLESGIWKDSTLKSKVVWRRSRTTDPTTHLAREISEDSRWDGVVEFRKNFVHRNWHLGAEYTLPTVSREFHFDEVRTERLGAMLDTYAAWNPRPLWELRLGINNLLDRSATRKREVYDGSRDSSALSYVEQRTLRIGRYVGVQARKTFGNR
jgi:outer membrane receptor protein involved in Fe transport